jgi:thioredoxin 1
LENIAHKFDSVIIAIMKSERIVLGAVALILGGMGWMLLDTDSASASSAIHNHSRLGSVLASSKPVLVEFYADWCGPCRSVGPEVDKLAVELRGRAEVVRLNVDENPELAQKYRVQGIPCFIAFKNGRETGRQSGAIPQAMMRAMIGM